MAGQKKLGGVLNAVAAAPKLLVKHPVLGSMTLAGGALGAHGLKQTSDTAKALRVQQQAKFRSIHGPVGSR
tara:strand:- start:469 stop:681 length:213 start_codon:yes stop_codon:yes gene_type:complete